MIYYPAIGFIGRLGNQMFQLAALKALSLELKQPAYLPENIDIRDAQSQKCLLNYFQHNCEFRTDDFFQNKEVVLYKFPENYEERNREEYYETKGDIIFLDGFPESEIYFRKHKDEIKKCFEIVAHREDISDFGREYIEELKKNTGREIVAVHIRRGDLSYLLTEEQWKVYPEYIQQFIDAGFSEDKYHFLFFTGGKCSDNEDTTDDVTWCKNIFSSWKNTSFCDVNNTLRELEIMKNCDHMILTGRSTFSWWGAYLIKNPNKKVYVPRNPFGGQEIVFPDVYWASEFTQITTIHPK